MRPELDWYDGVLGSASTVEVTPIRYLNENVNTRQTSATQYAGTDHSIPTAR